MNETLSNKNVFLNEKKTHRYPFLFSYNNNKKNHQKSQKMPLRNESTRNLL